MRKGARHAHRRGFKAVWHQRGHPALNVSIEALIEYMELFEGGDATLRARKTILEKEREKVRERMAEMQAGLDRLDYKIAHYEDLIVKAEQKMVGGPE